MISSIVLPAWLAIWSALPAQALTHHPHSPRSHPPTKKGAGVWASPKISSAVTDLGASWVYSWDHAPLEVFTVMGYTPPLNVDCVPVLPLFKNYSEAGLHELLADNPNASAVLGWGEPDMPAAPITPAAAAKLWPDIAKAVKAAGKRLGSPAAGPKWYEEFMAQGDMQSDFIALHYYEGIFDVGGGVENLRAYVQDFHDRYDKPIWITEYAMINYWDLAHVTTPDPATEADYMRKTVEMLDGLDYVERYSWFAVPQSDSQPPTNLLDPQGNINKLGEVYKGL